MLAATIAIAGNRFRALTQSGAIAAFFVGSLTFGFGGILPAVLILLFFLTSSLLSRVGKAEKEAVAAAFAKTGTRDFGQVLANGALPAFFSLLLGLDGHSAWLAALAGAIAAVNADTWSTEVGVLARKWPRLITTGARVQPGTSGGVTPEGTLAALGGAGLIALVSGYFQLDPKLGISVIVGGLMGALVDSYLGATVQYIYFCPSCEKETERHPVHICGTETKPLRGWSWLNNDAVNFLASATGAVLSAVLWLWA
jgi:uncharacterized protein (TIGR00297 family)